MDRVQWRKSSPVYFYVQRNTQFATKNVLIQFEIESLNVGGAMNLESGIFTAPRPGTYFFSISGFYDNFLYFAGYVYCSSYNRNSHYSALFPPLLRNE